MDGLQTGVRTLCRQPEHQCRPVDAVAQTGWLRAVVEDVAEMAVAGGALHFDSGQAEAVVPVFGQRIGFMIPETGPAGAAVEFLF